MERELTADEKRIMAQIIDGGDVWGYIEAKTLRAVERDFPRPRLIKITRAKNAPKDGAAHQPYFGAILTAAGRKALGLPAWR